MKSSKSNLNWGTGWPKPIKCGYLNTCCKCKKTYDGPKQTPKPLEYCWVCLPSDDRVDQMLNANFITLTPDQEKQLKDLETWHKKSEKRFHASKIVFH